MLVAVAAALAVYQLVERPGRTGVPLALLRAAAWGGVALLLVDPGCTRSEVPGTTVLLDASRSMTGALDSARWHAAVDSARALAGARGRILVFGDDLPRAWTDTVTPAALTSRLLPALRAAAAAGGPVAIVTDGEVDDAPAVPGDLLASARVLLLPRPAVADAGVALIVLPAELRAGDTATAAVDLAVAGASAGDTTTIELLEAGRVAARQRVALGAGGSLRRELRFVPAAGDARVVRRYEVRLAGWPRDAEPRNDRLATVAAVAPTSTIVTVSDQPDYDVRALAASLAQTSGVPVRSFVRLSASDWRDARTLAAVSERAVLAEASRATLVVAHGTAATVEAMSRRVRGALIRWPVGGGRLGDWYVTGGDVASPIGAALAGVAVESLPPLELQRDLGAEPAGWVAITVRRDRRGTALPALVGGEQGGRRVVDVGVSGLWRWASKGGVASEGYRTLVAAATDWLLAGGTPERAALTAEREALTRGAAELLPRVPTLREQPGRSAASLERRLPLRHAEWLYFVVIAALVVEWTARRRTGLR